MTTVASRSADLDARALRPQAAKAACAAVTCRSLVSVSR